MKRKLSCILLAFVMMLAAVPLLGLPAFAEDSVNLQTKVEKSNGQVIVTVSTAGELNADGISFEMEFDETAFELLKPKEPCDCTCEYVFGEEMESEPYRESPYYCSWVNLETVKDNNGNSILENGRYIMEPYKGELFKFVFDIKNDAEADKTYSFTPKNIQCATIEINDDTEKPVVTEKNASVNIDKKPINVELKEEDIPKGVTVSGQIQSYNPKNNITVKLKNGDNVIADTVIAGQTTGSGQKTQPFSIEAVPEGTYDLVVTKAGHLTYTIQNVIVGNEDIDLAAATDKQYQTITLLAGDVNGDGYIESGDLNIIWNVANYNKSFESADNKNADINGDGYIESSDLNIVWNSNNYNKTAAAHCTVSY